jgi:hypothetical protein
MSCCIIRKVPFKIETRIVWGLILSERDGMALLLLQRLESGKSHSLVFGVENEKGIFEGVNATRFPMEHGDLVAVGRKLCALGEEMDEDSFYRFLKPDDDEWWKNL